MRTFGLGLALLAAGVAPLRALPLHAAPRQAPTIDSAVADLPLLELPARGRGAFAVVLSADGGWVAADKHIAAELARRGIGVVGWNTRTYLEQRPRQPDDAARDLARVIRHYREAWGRDTVLVVGYSRGADLASFMVNRLPEPERARIGAVALLSPSARASFEFHWTDIVRNTHRPTDRDAQPELRQLASRTAVLCAYGREDEESLCPDADRQRVQVVMREGGHRLDGADGDALGALVADWFGRIATTAAAPLGAR